MLGGALRLCLFILRRYRTFSLRKKALIMEIMFYISRIVLTLVFCSRLSTVHSFTQSLIHFFASFLIHSLLDNFVTHSLYLFFQSQWQNLLSSSASWSWPP